MFATQDHDTRILDIWHVYMRIQTFMQTYLKTLFICKWLKMYIHINIYIYMRVVKFFHVENAMFTKKNLSPNFSEPQVYL